MPAVILVQRQLLSVAHRRATVVVSSSLQWTPLQTGSWRRPLAAPTGRRATPISLAPPRARAHTAASARLMPLACGLTTRRRGSLTLHAAARVPHSAPSRVHACGTTPASPACPTHRDPASSTPATPCARQALGASHDETTTTEAQAVGRCELPTADREQRASFGGADGQARHPHPSGTTPRTRARRSERTPHDYC